MTFDETADSSLLRSACAKLALTAERPPATFYSSSTPPMRNVIVLLAAGSILAACSTEKFVAGPEVKLTENYKYRAGLRGETIHPDTKPISATGISTP
jgi:hypothetical protein